jgi:hypothetical protein
MASFVWLMASANFIALEIAVEADDRAVHAQHPGIRLSATVTELLGCRQVQLEECELGVFGVGHGALPFRQWLRRHESARVRHRGRYRRRARQGP